MTPPESSRATDLFEIDSAAEAIGAVTAPGLAPPPRREAIERKRLLDQLSSARSPCVVVVAPAGFGKTTLLAQWVRADPRETVWMTLDERHDDPVFLIGRIAAALDRGRPLGDEVFAPLGGPSPDIARVVVPRLCEAIADRGVPVVLVLDDAHSISDPEALRCIAALAELLPEGSRLLIGSRSEPEIGVGRLRAHGHLGEIRTDALAMTRGEAAMAFEAIGEGLSEELVLRLVKLTEGWPAALSLAAVALRGENDAERVIESFAGDERAVADYLREEFLSSLDATDADFLIRSSLLDRLSGDLCDAVLESSGSAEALRRLSRSNLLLAPLDTKDLEFRIHALMREMLMAELRRRGPEAESELHRRASDWYSSIGETDRAVEHAVASGDVELAGSRISAVAVGYVTIGRRQTLQNWLGSFSEEELASVSTLCTTVAVVALASGNGDEMRHWGDLATEHLARIKNPEPSLVATAEIIRLSGNSSDSLEVTATGFGAISAPFPEASPWRAYSRFTEGVLRHLLGDRSRAIELLEEGARESALAPGVQTLCKAQLALVALDAGRSTDADVATSEAISRIELFGLEDYAASALPYGVAALVHAGRGDAIGAARLLSAASMLRDENPSVNDWFAAQVLITIARTQTSLGDFAAARLRLEQAEALCRSFPEAIVFAEWTTSVRRDLEAGAGNAARGPLTPAEVRLVHLLPTHLTFPEIAANLIVSTNTVKTQARSIYRKFGVSSRSDAVAHARAAGLLDEPYGYSA